MNRVVGNVAANSAATFTADAADLRAGRESGLSLGLFDQASLGAQICGHDASTAYSPHADGRSHRRRARRAGRSGAPDDRRGSLSPDHRAWRRSRQRWRSSIPRPRQSRYPSASHHRKHPPVTVAAGERDDKEIHQRKSPGRRGALRARKIPDSATEIYSLS